MVKFYSLTSLWSWWTSLRDVLTYDARILEHFSNLTCPVFLFFHFGSLHRPQDVLASHLGIFRHSPFPGVFPWNTLKSSSISSGSIWFWSENSCDSLRSDLCWLLGQNLHSRLFLCEFLKLHLTPLIALPLYRIQTLDSGRESSRI